MSKYIKINEPVEINPLTEDDLDAIRHLMPKFYTHIMSYDIDWTELYLVQDGVNIKIISQDVLDQEYTKL